MKKIKLSNKLNLRKVQIANLNELSKTKGGATTACGESIAQTNCLECNPLSRYSCTAC